MKHTLLRLSAVALLVGTLAACGTHAPSSSSASQAAAYVPIKAEQVQRQAIAKGVYELVYSPKRNAVFVASSGGWGDQADPAKIVRLNPDTLAVEAEIPLQRKAFGLALDDAAGRLYVGNTVDTSLTVVDIAAQREVAVIQLEQKVKGADGKERYQRDLRQLVVDPDNHRVYIAAHAFEHGSVLYVVNTDTLQVEKRIEGLGNAKAPGIWLDAATNRLFVTDQGSKSLGEYIAKTVPGYSSNGKGNRVVVLDADTGAVQASVPTGEGPLQLWLDAKRKRLYVTNRSAGAISVHHSDTYELLDTIPVPTHPNTLAQDAERNVVFVTIKNGEGDPKGSKESVARLQF
ncbi:YncE family protein [Pusillimonas sp. SM2304]|uniref:YncE family protein n=1 Tax=Pusillimonas sp. SM2304 TaxID=3073241 RepID=UPI0028742E52|nr:YncE family protein [Pusillimonas sp. SM2304]MDS1139204.1 YncE family protein [Pusillimonas sp. SM2304]